MSVILLERGMTAAAFDDYLAASSETSQLAGKLGAGVEGDLLIKIIARAGKADPLPLKPFFEDAHIGPLGNLALLIDSFVKVEKQQAKNAVHEKAHARSDEKRQKLLAAIEKEHEAAVGPRGGEWRRSKTDPRKT